MTITSIVPYEKGKNRVAVYLNDEFAFVLYKGELSKYDLKENMVLDDATYQRIKDDILYKRARLRGMNLLKTMDRTELDMRHRLSDGGYPEDVVDDAIEYLKSYHYIDDNRYASEYIRFKMSSLSRKEISRKLREKGVPDAIIESAFYEQDDSCDDSYSSERETCGRLMLKKCSNPSALEYEDRMKLFAYLYRKGFSMETIEHVYKNLL